MTSASVKRLLEQYPMWPHVPRGASPAQVAEFALLVLQGSTFHVWPDTTGARAFAAVQPAPWDTEKLGVPAARLFLIVPPESAEVADVVLAQTLAAADAAGFRYLVTRIDAGDLRGIQALEQAGFIVVDAILSQYLDVPSSRPTSGGLSVRSAVAGDAEALAAIVDESFSMSRFHGDPWIGVEKARTIYRDWARNIAAGLNDLNVVALLDGRVVGFLSCKDVPAARTAYRSGYGRIELVALAPDARGRGGVASMTQQLIAEAPARDWSRLGIGTQISNVRAIRAYQNVGFVPGDSIFTLRRLT